MGAGRDFLSATYFENMPYSSDQEKGYPQPHLVLEKDPHLPCIELPHPAEIVLPSLELRQAIEARRSLRKFDVSASLTLDDLSWLLWATQGVVRTDFVKNSSRTYRNVPSAGARHPFETWLIVRNVGGLLPGLYRYLALEHSLQAEDTERDRTPDFVELCKKQSWIGQAALSFVWVAEDCRAVWRYRERAYRGIFQDSGHICQNLYLAAMNIGCGVCGIGDFHDLPLVRFLKADENAYFPVYAAAVGRPLRPSEEEKGR